MITYGHHLPAFVKGIVSVLSYTLPPDNPPSDPEAGEYCRQMLTARRVCESHVCQAKSAWEHKKTMSERLRIEVAHTLACWARFGLLGS